MPIPSNYQPPVILSAKERAFEQVQQWIIDGTLKPGEKINDVELAKAIGISRTPVREALQLLGMQGFVSMKPGVATTVNESDPKDIDKLLPPLAALESLAAELAAPIIEPSDIAALRSLNTDFAAAIHAGNAYPALRIDEQIHDLIVKVCHNGYIETTTTMLQAHVRRLFYQRAIVLTKESITEHNALIDALAAHDAETAAHIAKNNWLRPIQCAEMDHSL